MEKREEGRGGNGERWVQKKAEKARIVGEGRRGNKRKGKGR